MEPYDTDPWYCPRCEDTFDPGQKCRCPEDDWEYKDDGDIEDEDLPF